MKGQDRKAIRTSTSQRDRQLHAFTLVEVLLALVIGAFVATAALGLMSATAYGTTSGRDARNVLVRTQVAGARIGAAVRSARRAIPYGGFMLGANYVVLWVNDENDDDAKQNNEMLMIALDSASGELRSYRDASDAAAFASASAFRTNAMSSYSYETWVTDVSAVQFRITTTGSTLVSYRVTVAIGEDSEMVVGAASPRQ